MAHTHAVSVISLSKNYCAIICVMVVKKNKLANKNK